MSNLAISAAEPYESKLAKVSEAAKGINDLFHKCQIFDNVVGTDDVIERISTGTSLAPICNALSLSESEIKRFICRNEEGRKRWMAAKLFEAGNKSLDTLDSAAGVMTLEKEEAAGAKHHRDMVSLSLTAINGAKQAGDATQTVVHNTVVVQDSSAIPVPPDHIKSILDAGN